MPRTGSHSNGKSNGSVQHGGLMGSAMRFWHVRHSLTLQFGKTILIQLLSLEDLRRRLRGTYRSPGWLHVCLYTSTDRTTRSRFIDTTAQVLTIAEPFHRMFSLDNLAIQFPHAAVERVPVSTSSPTPSSCYPWPFPILSTVPFHSCRDCSTIKAFPQETTLTICIGYNVLYSGIIPLLIILITTLLLYPAPTPNRFHKAHVTVLGLLISLILTSFLTDVIKNAVGRPRPDLLARCKAAKGTPPHQLVTIAVCTEKDHHILHDGWRSFPSGHSSFAFSGLGYLSLYVKHPHIVLLIRVAQTYTC